MANCKLVFLYLIFLLFPGSSFSQDTVLLAYKNKHLIISSSELDQGEILGFGKYGIVNLVDNHPSTAWVEGVDGPGLGEYFLIDLPANASILKIRNGYQKSPTLYRANARPKRLKVEFFSGYQPGGFVTEYYDGYIIQPLGHDIELDLKDTMAIQEFKLSIPEEKRVPDQTCFLKISILDAYDGLKWEDNCISDIILSADLDIELSSDQRTLFRIINGEYQQLFFSPDFIYDIISIGPHKRYCILTMMPAEAEGRVETVYLLYDTKEQAEVEMEQIGNMYDIIEKHGELYVEGENTQTAEVQLFKIPSN